MGIAQPASYRFISQRLSLNYFDWGNPDAPTLLLIHGGRDHARSWDWTAERLANDWHVVAVDLRGHGDSDWTSDGQYDFGGYLCDLAALVDHLGSQPVAIIGHSMGGMIATRFAGLYPDKVRALINIEGLGLPPVAVSTIKQTPYAERVRQWIGKYQAAASRAPKHYPTLEAACARMQAANPALSATQAAHLTQHGARQTPEGGWVWKYDPLLNIWPIIDMPDSEVIRMWQAITCPVLLMYGTASWASNPQKDGRMAHLQNAELRLFEAAGHWLHHDAFEKFIDAAQVFLSVSLCHTFNESRVISG